MKLININDYDICNYKKPAMFIIFPYCSFKCDKECGLNICQNSALAHEPIIEVRVADIIHRYLDNPLTHAVVCGGLEPFDNKDSFFMCLINDKEDKLYIQSLIYGNIIIIFS